MSLVSPPTRNAYRIPVVLLATLLLYPMGRVNAQQKIWELRPYKCVVLITHDQSPRWSTAVRSRLTKRLADHLKGWAGDAWSVDVRQAPATASRHVQRHLSKGDLDSLTPAKFVDIAKVNSEGDIDKVFVVALLETNRSTANSAPRVASWEWDAVTGTWSLPAVVVGRNRRVAHAASDAVLQAFRSIARIVGVADGKYQLRVRASEIGLTQPNYRPMPKGAALRICQSNAAEVGDSPLPQTFLIVESQDESFTNCRIHSRLGDTAVAKLVTDGRWYALEQRRGMPRTELDIRFAGAPAAAPIAVQIRRSDDQQVAWRGTLSHGKTTIPNRQVTKSARGVHLLEVTAFGFVVDVQTVVIGGQATLRRELPLTTDQFAALSALADCRAEVTEFATRHEISAQRIKSRIDAGRKDAAKELLETTRQREKKTSPGIVKKIAELQATFSTPANVRFKRHFDDLSVRWATVLVGQDLNELERQTK